jgi:hypothetical protein
MFSLISTCYQQLRLYTASGSTDGGRRIGSYSKGNHRYNGTLSGFAWRKSEIHNITAKAALKFGSEVLGTEKKRQTMFRSSTDEISETLTGNYEII